MKAVLIAAGVAALAVGLFALRSATIAREGPELPGSRLVVTFRVETKLMPTHELPLVASSIFDACRLQAEAGVARPVSAIGDGVFRAVLAPAPDATDRKQLSGCLSDVAFAHARSEVLSMELQRASAGQSDQA